MLIDKDDVKKELEAFADTLTVIGGSYIRSAIRLAIDPMKETDAVPVIRCKDCKYCDKGIDEDGKPFLKCLGWVYGGTSETDFCSHAERRQDEID